MQKFRSLASLALRSSKSFGIPSTRVPRGPILRLFSTQADPDHSHEPSVPQFTPIKIHNADTKESLVIELNDAIRKNKVVLLMKGSPDEPQCGYSRFVAQLLLAYGVRNFAYLDVLSTESIRENAKNVTQWPTYPQLFIHGQFVGGADVLKTMHQDGTLEALLATVNNDDKDKNK
jgi:monothiol glutaredoxin